MDLQLWNDSVHAYLDNKDPTRTIELIQQISNPGSRVLYNLSRCYQLLGQLHQARQCLDLLVEKDSHNAVGFFQRGVINFKLNNYSEAYSDFESSQKWVQHGHIDYAQLGMRYKLYLYEVVYNAAITLIKLNQVAGAIDVLGHMRSHKPEMRNKKVESLYENLQNGLVPAVCELIEIPSEMVFRPPKYKPKSEKKVDYLGQAKVLSAIDANDQITGFAGPHRSKPETLSSTPSATSNQDKSGIPAVLLRRQSEPILDIRSSPSSGRKASPADHGPPPDRPVPRLPPSVQRFYEPTEERQSAGPGPAVKLRMSSEEPPERPPPRKANLSSLVTSMTMSSDENTAPETVPPRPPKRISNPDPAGTPTKVKVEFSCNEKQVVLLQKGASLRELKSTACQVFELKPANFDLWTEEPRKKLSSEADVKELWRKFEGDKLSLSCYGKK